MYNSAKPMLSVIIPAHNAQSTIDRCLTSVLSAAPSDVEVIVVDDGSTDNTAQRSEAYSRDGRVEVLRQGQLGVSAARNRGVAVARSDYVMFVDADDELIGRSLSDFLGFTKRMNCDIAIGDFMVRNDGVMTCERSINSDKRVFGSDTFLVFEWLCLARIGFQRKKNIGLLGAPWAKVYRRDFLRNTFRRPNIFPVGVKTGEDVLFNAELFRSADLVGYFPRPVYIYEIWPGSTSHRRDESFLPGLSDFIWRLRALVEGMDAPELLYAYHRRVVISAEEAVRRLGPEPSASAIRAIVASEPFASSIRACRFRDCSMAGMVKVALLKLKAYRTCAWLIGLRAK